MYTGLLSALLVTVFTYYLGLQEESISCHVNKSVCFTDIFYQVQIILFSYSFLNEQLKNYLVNIM